MSKEEKNKKLYELIEEIGEIIIDSVKRQVIKAIDELEIDIEIEDEDEDEDICQR
jgi:hypothetical protein